MMNPIAKTLISLGLLCVLLGMALEWGGKFGLGRLPGDIVIERPGFRFYFPIATSLLVSALISIVLYILKMMKR
jgi:hypothetical protein